MRNHQRGITAISLVMLIALVGVVAYGAIRLIPVYQTQMQVRSVLNALEADFDGQQATPAQIKSALSKQLDINMISFPHVRDFVVRKSDAGLTVGVRYEDRVPYVGNISLVAEFDNQVEIRR